MLAQRLLHPQLVDDPVEHRVRNSEDAVSTLVQPLRRTQIHDPRLVLEHPRDLVRADLQNLGDLSHRIERLFSAAIRLRL